VNDTKTSLVLLCAGKAKHAERLSRLNFWLHLLHQGKRWKTTYDKEGNINMSF